MKSPSKIVSSFKESIFSTMTAKANKLGAINLSQGFPDFDVHLNFPPDLIKKNLDTRFMFHLSKTLHLKKLILFVPQGKDNKICELAEKLHSSFIDIDIAPETIKTLKKPKENLGKLVRVDLKILVYR